MLDGLVVSRTRYWTTARLGASSPYLSAKPCAQPVAASVERHSLPLPASERDIVAMRWPTWRIRATFSARSIWRASQNRLSAVRASIGSASSRQWRQRAAGLEHPRVLGAAALARIDDQRSVAQRHARKAAGDDPYAAAVQHERTQVDVARRDAAVDERRARRQRKRRLRNVVVGSRANLGRKARAFFPGRARTDEHAVAARAARLLDDELGKMLEHVREIVLFGAAPRVHVSEQRLFAEIEADHLWHERIDALVVGDAGADGVGDRDRARAIRAEQAGYAERRVRAKRERIEVVVVEPPVDHVDAFRPLGGAHEHDAAVDEQVDAFDELDAHLG